MFPFRSPDIAPASGNLLSGKWSNTIPSIKFIFARMLLKICADIPLPAVHGLARIYAKLSYLFPTRAKSTTRINLGHCFPEMTSAERDRLVRLSLKNTAMTALEMGKAWFWPMERTLGMIREIEGAEILQRALDDKKGAIVLAPHLGNWEVFGFYVSEQAPATFLYQPPRDPTLDQLIKQARTRGKVRLAPTNRQGVAELFRALKRGEIAGILPDQEPPLESGIFADFFGVPALTMTLVAKLVERTGARVICGFARRLPDGKGFKLEIIEADSQIYSEDTAISVMALNKTVESCVRLAVEQYQWEYKRFKRRPDGGRFY
ncbi:MAG: lysophospholipid acyltransferase family protein [Pseudohongiellaceae bacterium]